MNIPIPKQFIYNPKLILLEQLQGVLSDAVIGAEFGTADGVVYRTNGTLGPIFCSPLAVAFENAGAPLPIELISFEGKAMEKENKLEWATSSEENTEWHIIERSLSGERDWEEIGRLEAAGNSSNIVRYELMDINPIYKAYYRLRSVDYDLREEVSKIIFIQRQGDNGELNIYPNPVTKKLTVEIGVSVSSDYDISIVNMMGQIVTFEQYDFNEGDQRIEMDVDHLANGIYHIVVENKTGKQIQRFVKN